MYFNEGSGGYLTTESFRLGIEIDERRASLEMNNEKNIVTQSFLRSRTGVELVSAVERAGLVFSDRLLDALQGHNHRYGDFSTRYGNSYAELSREVAKLINDPKRSLRHLFNQDDAEVVDAILGMDSADLKSTPTRVLVSLMQHALGRDSAKAHASSIRVHVGAVQMNSGSCKDAETYFGQSSTTGDLSVSPDKVMLHKSSGEKTAINLEPVVYNGVELPPGCLFQVHADGYTFVRLTSFCFEEDDAADAFTWQYKETVRNRVYKPSSDFVTRINERFRPIV
jgi:hypothetical protein